jgi:hypothetical protein
MKEWERYFVLTGTGAVTLIGLLFVVIPWASNAAIWDY